MITERYRYLHKPGHPNACASGQILAHVFVMSGMIGRPLTALEVVHHIDRKRGNNLPANLMLFATQEEHLQHHARERAFLTCGNAEFRLCCYCKEYDDPSNLSIRKTRYQAYHKACAAKANHNR